MEARVFAPPRAKTARATPRGHTAMRSVLVLLAAMLALAAPAAASARAQKSIVVSISQQVMWAYKGDRVVLSSYVSTGKAGFDTPVGSYVVLTKLVSQTMAGIIGGESYNVPDVPWVMYFTNGGHALHGTYWHANFGWPMSHGCVNLPLDVAAWLYDWTPVGTPVLVVP
jgi:lipoprotein-anchoring transpeptidase ErfK/SrfK